ncbi:MAG TPA: hypothetical protein VNG33_13545, partial [Polyangiaceae bacterium]|nr:hypothetical protein [Polyangiaceae bacterium]
MRFGKWRVVTLLGWSAVAAWSTGACTFPDFVVPLASGAAGGAGATAGAGPSVGGVGAVSGAGGVGVAGGAGMLGQSGNSGG